MAALSKAKVLCHLLQAFLLTTNAYSVHPVQRLGGTAVQCYSLCPHDNIVETIHRL